MEIDKDMIEHMDHVALDIDPKKYIDGAILSKLEAEELTVLAGRLLMTPRYGKEVMNILMAMLKPKEYEKPENPYE